MGETTTHHVDLRRSRRIGLAASLTVCGTMLLVAVSTWALGGSRIDLVPLDIPWPVADLVSVLQFPMPRLPRFSLPRILWIVLGFAIVGLVLYALLTGSRRAVPARGAGFTVFLLGWACTAPAVGAAAIVFGVAGRVYWPDVDLWRMPGMLYSAAGWGLIFGWLGGLAAALTYSITSSPAHRAASPSTRRASWTPAASSAVFLGLLFLVSGLLTPRDPVEVGAGYLNLITFPDPVSGSWYFSEDPPGFVVALDLGALLFLTVAAVVTMTLLLGAAVRFVRPRGGAGGVFMLGWGCTILVAGGVGVLKSLIFLVVDLASQGEFIGSFPYSAAIDGAAYGLLVGWLMGAVAMVAHLRSRPREAASTDLRHEAEGALARRGEMSKP
ncbi:hypothetical protein [Nonomuraea cavernae]|uniref:hypothetical protein n=1 Tax=Nonomuraea cavernae TaxID=2045107 RepID=UPI0033CC95C2